MDIRNRAGWAHGARLETRGLLHFFDENRGQFLHVKSEKIARSSSDAVAEFRERIASAQSRERRAALRVPI